MKDQKPDSLQRFESLMTRLFRVPHAEVKAKLDAEKKSRTARKAKDNEQR